MSKFTESDVEEAALEWLQENRVVPKLSGARKRISSPEEGGGRICCSKKHGTLWGIPEIKY